jgi:predicted acetyltransferase
MERTVAKTREDLEEIADVMSKIYTRRSYFDFYKMRMDYQTKDPYYKPEHSFIIKADGKIVSHVSIIEKYMRIGSAVVKIAGIGDVYTLPEHRKKNFSRMLMEDALSYMREHHYPLSMLYGIHEFYHKFGYIEALNEYWTAIPTRHLRAYKPTPTIRPFREEDTPVLNRLYNEAFSRKTCSMRRVDTHWWRIAHPTTTVVVTDTDAVKGYAIFDMAQRERIVVNEAVAPEPQATDTLLAEMGCRAAEALIPEVELHMAPDCEFVERCQPIGVKNTIHVPYEGFGQGMLRIVNLFELLQCIQDELSTRLENSGFARHDGEFQIVTDAGSAMVTIQRGCVTVSEAAGPGDAERLEVPQNLLVRSIVGFWPVHLLLERSGVDVGSLLREVLEVLFPKGHPFTSPMDYF